MTCNVTRVRWNSHKCVEILLQHIPVNSVTAGGNTALHLACQSHNRETLELLLLHPDIDPDIVNNQVASCLELQTNHPQSCHNHIDGPYLVGH